MEPRVELTGDVTGGGDGEDAGGEIAGGVIGGLVAALALAGGAFLLQRRRKTAQPEPARTTSVVLSAQANFVHNFTNQTAQEKTMDAAEAEKMVKAAKELRQSVVALQPYSERHEHEKPLPPEWAPLDRPVGTSVPNKSMDSEAGPSVQPASPKDTVVRPSRRRSNPPAGLPPAVSDASLTPGLTSSRRTSKPPAGLPPGVSDASLTPGGGFTSANKSSSEFI